jgi:hypothetical protein
MFCGDRDFIPIVKAVKISLGNTLMVYILAIVAQRN